MAEINVRQSQIAHTYAVGSIGDFPGVSGMFLSHDHEEYDWGKPEEGLGSDAKANKRRTIIDKRLSNAFGIENFVLPPLNNISNNSLKIIRFPMSLYCPACYRIHFINELEKVNNGNIPYNGKKLETFDDALREYYCTDCLNNSRRTVELVPTRFIIANLEGFIDDFPWDWYVHRKPEKRNERRRGHKLYLNFGGSSTSLGSISVISKDNTNKIIAVENLGEIFNQDKTFISEGDEYLPYVKNKMPQPWLGRDGDKFVQKTVDVPPPNQIIRDTNNMITGANAEIVKRAYPRTLQRGANNLYFPLVFKGIRLPEGLNEIDSKLITEITRIKRAYSDVVEESKDYSSEQWISFFKDKKNNNVFKNFSEDDFSIALEILFPEENESEFIDRKQKLRLEEFFCFGNTNIVKSDEIWYKTRHISFHSDFLENSCKIEKITLLDKINELKIFRGFTRIKPIANEDLIFETDKNNLSSQKLQEYNRICDARKYPHKTNELPCSEVKGEGIFLKFNNSALKQWENKESVQSRFGQMKSNLLNYFSTFDIENGTESISARYVFLHTLSHIIMQQLANDSGYSLSSLTEIIYCNKPNEHEEMNGILIYTSSSDTEGTLGGLVEKGESNRLSPIISKGIDKAKWCSSDPLCITSNGQGFMTTNMAACYSCVMVPETCCENINKFLDRKLVLDFFNIETL